jgi:hypothetical protein
MDNILQQTHVIKGYKVNVGPALPKQPSIYRSEGGDRWGNYRDKDDDRWGNNRDKDDDRWGRKDAAYY